MPLLWDELALPGDVEETASKIRRVALAVHREVGPGFREATYQRCLAHALRQAGHRVDEHVAISVEFRGIAIPRAGEADMLVDDVVVVELKAREAVHPNHVAQLVGYLRAMDKPLGILLNFHARSLLREGYSRAVHPRYLVPRER